MISVSFFLIFASIYVLLNYISSLLPLLLPLYKREGGYWPSPQLGLQPALCLDGQSINAAAKQIAVVYLCTLATLLCHDNVELCKSADGWIDTQTASGTLRLPLDKITCCSY